MDANAEEMVVVMSRGVYSLSDAARLLRARRSDLKRWAFGYERRGQRYPAVIKTELPPVNDDHALTFVELVELMFIQAARSSRMVSFDRIHEAARVLREVLHTDHPFALKRFFLDPAGLYAETGVEGVLLELKGAGQMAMWPTLRDYLHQLDFDVDNLAERWFPAGKDAPVVVDPAIAFGSPVIQGTRITTDAIASMVAGGTPVDEVAWWFDLESWKVEAAVAFERGLTAA